MKLLVCVLLAVCSTKTSFSQALSFDQLHAIVTMKHKDIDTLMKSKGYIIMEREKDSTTSLVYYSSLERKEEAPSWVRSLTVMDAEIDNYTSRMLKYRIYSPDEYRELMAWLLANYYSTQVSNKYPDSQHTTFKSGENTILVKVIKNRLKSGKVVTSYEFELGR